MNRFKKWLEERKAQERQDAFDNGFGFAMTRHFIHKQSVSHIADGMEGDSAFDSGIDKALMTIERLQDASHCIHQIDEAVKLYDCATKPGLKGN